MPEDSVKVPSCCIASKIFSATNLLQSDFELLRNIYMLHTVSDVQLKPCSAQTIKLAAHVTTI